MRVGDLAVHRELIVPPGGGAMTERWTLGVEQLSPGDEPGVIAPAGTAAVITVPAGQAPGFAVALLLVRATELGLSAMTEATG